jgi:hypothetical protein
MIREDESKSYAEVLATARNKTTLSEIGINTLKMSRTMTGGVILEVPGDKGRETPFAPFTSFSWSKNNT